MKLHEIIEIYNDINIGFKSEEKEILPLLNSNLKISIKGKLHKISNELKAYVDEFEKSKTETFKSLGEEKEGQIIVPKEALIELNTKLFEIVNEEIDLDLSQFKFKEEELDLSTELPLVSFCKYLL